MTDLLLVEPVTVVKIGITQIINSVFPGCYITNVETFDKAIEEIDKGKHKVIMTDINVAGGESIAMIDAIRIRDKKIKILIFSHYKEEVYGPRFIKAGANGYLRKDADQSEIAKALCAISFTGTYVSLNISRQISEGSIKDKHTGNPLSVLSNREIEVMELLNKGHSCIQISNILSLGLSTVSTYKARVFLKLNVSNCVDMTKVISQYYPPSNNERSLAIMH